MGKQMFKNLVSVALLVISGMICVVPVVAQNTVWRIDSEQSTARLLLSSSQHLTLISQSIRPTRVKSKAEKIRITPSSASNQRTSFRSTKKRFAAL
jgi:hypothetical protein